MSEKDNGGPAFPCEDGSWIKYGQTSGMCLRDWLAGQAIVGLAQNDVSPKIKRQYAKEDAKTAYAIADAMLAERSKK